jgi:hypothetical protein
LKIFSNGKISFKHTQEESKQLIVAIVSSAGPAHRDNVLAFMNRLPPKTEIISPRQRPTERLAVELAEKSSFAVLEIAPPHPLKASAATQEKAVLAYYQKVVAEADFVVAFVNGSAKGIAPPARSGDPNVTPRTLWCWPPQAPPPTK